MKWSWNTKMLVTLGDWFSSKVVSMLVKSTCMRSRGAVAMIGCRGPWTSYPHVVSSMYRSYWTAASDWSFLVTKSIPAIGTESSHSPDVLHPYGIHLEWWPNAPLGLWWANISFLPLGVECRYRALCWIMKFCQFLQISHPSSLEACSPKSVFSSVFFGFNQSKTALSTGSSLWASAQSVMCIWTNMHPAVTCTSCSKLWSPSTTAGLWISTHCAAPRLFPWGSISLCSGLSG